MLSEKKVFVLGEKKNKVFLDEGALLGLQITWWQGAGEVHKKKVQTCNTNVAKC